MHIQTFEQPAANTTIQPHPPSGATKSFPNSDLFLLFFFIFIVLLGSVEISCGFDTFIVSFVGGAVAIVIVGSVGFVAITGIVVDSLLFAMIKLDSFLSFKLLSLFLSLLLLLLLLVLLLLLLHSDIFIKFQLA